MTIEKTYKLNIKGNSYELTEAEISTLYEACRKALNISLIGPIPNIPNPSKPYYPSDYPSWPNYLGSGDPHPWNQPIVTCNNTDNSDCTNKVTPSTGINFIKKG